MISASGWLFKKKSITMHGNVNVKLAADLTDYWKKYKSKNDKQARKQKTCNP